MKLTKKQIEIFQGRMWKYKIDNCPICKKTDMTLTESSIGFKDEDYTIPLVVATCLNCGYTMLFNAKVLGFVD